MIGTKSVSICNLSRARLVNSSRNRTFHGGTQIWCTRTEDSLNLGGQALHRWNLRLMPNISYAGCPGLFWMVSAQFDLSVYCSQKSLKIHYKPLFLGFKGESSAGYMYNTQWVKSRLHVQHSGSSAGYTYNTHSEYTVDICVDIRCCLNPLLLFNKQQNTGSWISSKIISIRTWNNYQRTCCKFNYYTDSQ